MWKRFGTPTTVARSGTEQEFNNALEIWQKDASIHILFYFCRESFPPPMELEEINQLEAVVSFRNKLSKIGLVWEYATHVGFADVVRPHLIRVFSRMFSSERAFSTAVKQTGKAQVEGYGSITRERLTSLAREYQQIRELMPPGDERTQRMAVVFAEMKSQAISSYPLLQELAASSAPGERLAAISILQVLPNPQMLSWLAERPAQEMPFVAYHAVVALLIAVRNLAGQYYQEVKLALDQAKKASSQGIQGFDRDRDDILKLAEQELEGLMRT
jgi:hypothetical protein